uniref:Uncharacterized protein n=1 Tax=Plectus sambesii TaxID=2011161 RepID=A0A914WJP6_9BILA
MPDNDLLDLSKRGLNKFPVDISEGRDYEEIKRLNLCGNCFQTLEGLARFPALRDIDASFNELHRLACFLSVKATLQQLNVASNQICTADNLNSLEKLQTLNMAGNKLEQFPILDRLIHLRELDLSGNRLTKLPNLSHLPSLVSVSLRELRISSLAEAAKALPNSLQSLDLSFNFIRDLSEALWLSHLRNLESLSFSGNPCVSTDCRAFDYRPYLINCCLNLDTIGSPNLRTIDGFVVSETEQLKGTICSFT